jgi:4-amino-4-deoxy-L-arabinose transferase-like glycosyltransferase
MNRRLFHALRWAALVLAAVVFLGWGLVTQGFWETPAVKATDELPSQVPRQRPVAEPSEFSRFLELEEASSATWPPLTQWMYRGAARLGSPVEATTRLPSLLAVGFLLALLGWFVRRHGRGDEAWWTALALISTPFFLLWGRTLQLEALPALFHTATVLFLYEAFFGSDTSRTRVIHGGLAGAAAILGVLTGGWVWGALFAPVAFGTGALFARRELRVSRRQALIILGMLSAAGLLFYSLRPVVGAWFFPESNPALVVPSPRAPHAVFTAFLARVVFGAFPWSVIALVGLFAGAFLPASQADSREKSPPDDPATWAGLEPRFFAGWLLAVLLLGAYHEMRVGPAVFLGIAPLAVLGALALTRTRELWWTPAVALLLALSALLVFRDLAMYPQILPELASGVEIPSVRLRLGPWLLPLGLAVLLPLGVLAWRRLDGAGAQWLAFWRSLRAQSMLFFLVTWPLDLAGRGLGFLWARRPAPGCLGTCRTAVTDRLPSIEACSPGIAAVAFLTFGGWFSLHVIPELTRELSSRPVFAEVARHARDADGLAVFEGSPRPAPVYANRPAAVLGADADLTAYMRSATEGARRFVVFPERLLGKMDYLSRTGGWPYHVLRTDSLTWRLAVTALPPGTRDANPLLKFVSTERPPFRFPVSTTLEDAMEVVGYDVPRVAARGQNITVRLVFRVMRPLPADHKIFIHLDPPYGTRITADHEPVQGLLPTRYFAPGTYVVDEYAFRIPKVGYPVGRYGVFAGLFTGNNRVKVTGGAHAGQDRIPLGPMEITNARGWFGCGGAARR